MTDQGMTTRSSSKDSRKKQVPALNFSVDVSHGSFDTVRNSVAPIIVDESTGDKTTLMVASSNGERDREAKDGCKNFGILHPRSVGKSETNKAVEFDCASAKGSITSSNKRSTSKPGSSRSALLIAELKAAQLVEKFKRERAMREHEEECKLQEMKDEIDMARLKAALSEDEQSDGEEQHDHSRMEGDKNIDRFLNDCRKAQEQCPGRMRITEDVRVEKHDELPRRAAIKCDLPRLTLSMFDGNVREYWSFIKQFDLFVEGNTDDPGQRLLYLLNHCTGPAKEAINNCIVQPPVIGYPEARAILKDAYGQPHQISSCMIEDLLNHPRISDHDTESLFRLSVKMNSSMIALEEMNYMDGLNSLYTLERLVLKLPASIREKWGRLAEEFNDKNMTVKFKDLVSLLRREAKYGKSKFGKIALSPTFIYDRKGSNNKAPTREYSSPNRIVNLATGVKLQSEVCVDCGRIHPLDKCPVYNKRSVVERWTLLKRVGCCYRCLKRGHVVNDCPVKELCESNGCNMKHHLSLHNEQKIKTFCSNVDATVAMGVVPVRVYGPLGELVVYALLDNGSNATLVKSKIVDRLGIRGATANLTVETITSTLSMDSLKCDFAISSLDRKEYVNIHNAYSVKDLPSNVQARSPSEVVENWSHLNGLHFDVLPDKEVCLLIGCDTPEAHWPLERKLGLPKEPFAIRTMMGWVLFGPTGLHDRKTVVNNNIIADDSIWCYMKNMYNHEFRDVIDDGKVMSIEERRAVEIVKKGTRFDGTRYVIPLPWKAGMRSAPDNRSNAYKRLVSLKTKFDKDPGLFEKYDAIIKQHVSKGFVESVENSDTAAEGTVWYLPHHPVFNPKKPGKVRMVFDCAARYWGKSLNDRLYQGPDTISNLVGILLRFRRYPIALAADIEEMFLQVKVPDEDKNALRFLWWPDEQMKGEPDCYRIRVHPFGATSSPFCANFALRRTIEDFGSSMSIDSRRAADKDFYVDDCITSVTSVDGARKLVCDIRDTLHKGGFRIRKWISNCKEALIEIPAEDLASGVFQLQDYQLPTERTLGIEWNAETDEFRFKFDYDNKEPTRRNVLSCISCIFDPLGLIAPLILSGKAILQNVCKSGCNWDDRLKDDDLTDWTEWKGNMKELGCVTIPRCAVGYQFKCVGSLQLHLFSDASEKGYGAVAYVRSSDVNDQIVCRLLMAKARVAPCKTITIPRLELSAAVLAVRLERTIRREIDMTFKGVYFWTDSMIVLRYINNTTSRFCTFVANRIQEIHDSTQPSQWNHVGTQDNPADFVSRGMNTTDMDLWLKGPQFLREREGEWPTTELSNSEEDMELKKGVVVRLTNVVNHPMDALLGHYSGWTKLRRAVAWMVRFQTYLRMMSGSTQLRLKVGPINSAEILNAEKMILIYVQKSNFTMEYNDLYDNRPNGRKQSRLKRLAPMMRDGLMVVGGRAQLSNWSEESKHPIILPKSHPVTSAIIDLFHRSEGHSGVAHVLAATRRRYWIVQGSVAIRRRLNQCLICKRQSAIPATQQLAPLLPAQVNQGWFPFQYVGVDFFGPLLVKHGRSLEKRYGCLFTCLQCRAIHIELAQCLSTDSFIMSLMRFVNRRGMPVEIHSDNGSNFVGANRELKLWVKNLQQDRIVNKLNERNIKWCFNPPMASHRGGAWERMIRSIRRILVSSLGPSSVDEETLTTYLTYAERILNDRPLTITRSDVDELSPIRPSDLLQPRSHDTIPLESQLETLAKKRWKIVNNLTATFWKRWRNEYIPMLQVRQKWMLPSRDLRVGDIVNVVTESTPKGFWPLGVIEEVYRSADGLIRTVDIKTTGGVIRRDVRKVCLLEGIG